MEKLNRQALKTLRESVFPTFPAHIQAAFPTIKDENGDPQPNIVIGSIQELGASPAFPLITVDSEGAPGSIVGCYIQARMSLDFWVSSQQGSNMYGRRFVSILQQYAFKIFNAGNWSGNGIMIETCFEIERSKILFEPTNKVHHIATVYRVAAVSQDWY